ncbi:RNA-dependent RNA polymerase [pepper chlorosis associated virus]|nr:RNA-dependent RNA polymerase [pepper chlorosis associated virus]
MDEYMIKNKISSYDAPSVRNLLSQFKNDFTNLESTIKKEKGKEAKEVVVEFDHVITDVKSLKDNDLLNIKKIGTPATILKLNSPYKEITPRNIKMIMSNDYPEKWSDKNNIELLLFRKLFLREARDDGKSFNSVKLSQESSIDLVKKLKRCSISSPESAVLLKFAGKIMEKEISSLEKSFLGTQTKEARNYEITDDGARNYWVLDVFEHLNKNIMRSSSAEQHKRELDISIDYYEGKRLNTRYFPVGASISKIEFERDGNYLIVFLSSTICGYYWSDEKFLNVGRPDMLQYSLYLADNLLTLSLIRQQSSEEEKRFIDYYVSLLNKKEFERMGMGSLYETTCLLLSDAKTLSASMPILDNLVDSIAISLPLTEEIVSICMSSRPETCIKMSSIGKTLIIASTKPGKGISRYTQRTNRDNKVNPNTIRRLRSLFRQRVITSYIKKHGRVPALINVPEDLGAQLEMKAAGGNYLNHMISEVSRYNDVRLGKFLEPGEEMNLQSRIIDKACTKDKYDPISNSEKEVHYYITHDMKDVFLNPIGIEKEAYRESSRISKVVHRKEPIHWEMKEFLTVRLSEKEREQKTAARFYGIASFKLKLWISSVMEMVKRAMKLLPGQMMTMTDDERREIMFRMSEKLLQKDTYSLFLDYSGHNTSQRPENTNFIMEEIANMYGYFEGSKEYEEFTSLPYVFCNINVIVEDSWSDMIYYSKGQLGAIEGWLGGLWGIQSQLMLEDMFMQLGVKDYIGTTYSDDSCGVFTQSSLDVGKLNGIIRNVQRCGEDMGLIVKLSQTQVTNGRCSMLKEHYYKGAPIEMTVKKMMSISQNGPAILHDELELSGLIDSGYTSSCARATYIWTQTLLRNFKFIKLVGTAMRKNIEKLMPDTLDDRYKASINNYEITMKAANRALQKDIKRKAFIPPPRTRNIEFYQFHINDENILENFLMFMYSPYTCYGYALTPMPDVLISGFSLSNIKRICYLQGLLSEENVKRLGSFINLSQNAISYIDNPFPMTGGRKDTSLIIKPEIERLLPKIVKNTELLDFLLLYSKEEENQFKQELVQSFKNSFSARIVSKFLECSLYTYVHEIISKIDNAATMKMLLGGKKMMELIDKAWQANFKLKLKQHDKIIINYEDILFERNYKETIMPDGEKVKLNFLNIEEIPIMGKLIHSKHQCMVQPIFKGTVKLTEEGKRSRPPQKTFMNAAKFDKELGVDGMFEHKLIFKAYDLVRYVKWIIMEQDKFSGGMNKGEEEKLISICDETLGTFTDAKYSDIEENVVCPKGGRYFHRALAGGFNPKTGDLSSNLSSGNYDITGVDQLIAKTGGVDNNLNLQYLMIYSRICLSFLEPKPWNLESLTLTNDVISNIKDVSFKLKGLEKMKATSKVYNLASKKKIQSRGKMYYNYSTFVERDEDLSGKFINHVSTNREHFVEMESAFRSVNSYMLDQLIVSPELISDEILKGLIGEKLYSRGRMIFFDDFYRYYKSLNIIGEETPSRSVIRGLLYEEMFGINKDSIGKGLWADELIKYGHSSGFKRALMRLFILSTSLSYRITENDNNMIQIQVNKQRTILNSKHNFERIRKGNCQFYIKDKRITEMILNSFPTLGYCYSDVHHSANELCDEINGIEFEQLRLGSYYLELHQSFTEKRTDAYYGTVEYNSIDIDWKDLVDNRGIESAMKGFETACSLMVSPEKVSSPTMSAVYPSARGLLSLLKGNGFIGENDSIIELCGGRGDFHLAMMEEKIKHTTLSREDGYNLAMRIPGMTSKKVRFNCFRQSDYIHYFDHSIILLDISHITDKKDCLSGIMGDAKLGKKKMILRLNGLNKFLNEEILKELDEASLLACVPVLESPGYVYLTIDFTSVSTEVLGGANLIKMRKELKGYNRSLLSSSLINSVSKVSLKGLITVPPKKVQDQTQEVISDHTLTEMLLEEDPEYIHINNEIKTKITSIEQFRDNMMVYITEKTYLKLKSKLIVPNQRLVTTGEKKDKIPKNLLELSRKLRETDEEIVEVDSKIIRGNGLIIVSGVKNMDHDEMMEFMEDIVNVRDNRSMSLNCWKLILSLSGTEEIVNSEKIIDMVNIQKFRKTIDRTINSSYEIASKAVLSFKTGRIIEGLLAVANMGNVKRKAILDHKDKTTRTNILHYKLYINRIMMLSRMMYNEPFFVGINSEKFSKLWDKIGEEGELIDMKRIRDATNDCESLNKFFAEINSEFFSFADHFNSAVVGLGERLEETIGSELIVEQIEDFGLTVTQEDKDLNAELNSFDKILEYLGEDEVFGAWGDCEDDYSE